ncbi:hypothetical protein RYZ26_10715 [Terasakiella sp. A23]|uniref:hypothetical protein n=1 Tax=Terasakiella sp. FCG-A23 TaxID=3080561 RepID=UPI0029531E24|nr:hypothetical protein [Terasakiella sp. A23]MDV7340066.1 hypothetical protein [Terasakiella sp. A23]
MRILILILFFVGLSFQVQAQSPRETVKEVGQIIFSEMEKRVIREVMDRAGVKPAARSKDEEMEDDDDDNGGKKHKNKGKGKGNSKGKGKNKGMPPGLAKKDQLPKGLAKRDTLPPGLAKRDLPQEVTRRLPPPAPGTERVIVDNDVLLVETGTQIVLDIIKDVITKR